MCSGMAKRFVPPVECFVQIKNGICRESVGSASDRSGLARFGFEVIADHRRPYGASSIMVTFSPYYTRV
jgi:hypothetical protein